MRVFALALLARLAHVAALSRTPFFDGPIIDSGTYVNLGHAIARGEGFRTAFFQPPLYPAILGALESAGLGLGWPLLGLQALVGALTCVGLVVLAQAWMRAHDARLARATGIGAGLVAALYGPLIAFDAEMLPPAFVNAAIVGAFAFASTGPRGARARDVVAGLLLGLATTGWTLSLALVPALPFLRPMPRKARLLAAALCLAGLAIPLTITASHNASHDAAGTLVSWNGGLNLWIGNNPEWRDTWRARPGADFHPRAALARRAGAVTPGAQDEWFRARALEHIAEAPGAFMMRSAEKLYLLFHGRELRRNQDLELLRRSSPLLRATLWELGLRFPFGLLFPLALFGLWRMRDSAAPRAVAVSLLLYSMAISVFFVAARYRLPLAALAIPLAVSGALDASLNRRPSRGEWAALALTFLALNAPNSFSASFEATDWERSMLTAQAHRARGDHEVALEIAETLVAAHPDEPDLRMLRAEGLSRRGPCGSAAEDLRFVATHVRGAVEPWMALGQCARREGRAQDAERAFANALAIEPSHSGALSSAAQLYSSQGRFEHALALYRRLLESGQGGHDARFDYGSTLLRAGLRAEAAEVLSALLEERPDDTELAELVRRARGGS